MPIVKPQRFGDLFIMITSVTLINTEIGTRIRVWHKPKIYVNDFCS